MDFSLTEDQQLIRDTAADFLADAASSAALRAAIARSEAGAGCGHDEALWARLAAELGWCATAIPEVHGGLGLGTVELVLLFEQLGRRLTPAPFFATVALAANALQRAGSAAAQACWLPPIAAGGLRASLALGARGVGLGPPGVTARRSAAGWRLDGRIGQVPDAASADLLLLLASLPDEGGAPGLFALPGDTAGLLRRHRPTWDVTRPIAELQLDGVQLGEEARVDAGALAPATLEAIEAHAALLLAAEQLGGAQQCLDLTLAYTAERRQFGQAIAAFQAVKHRCAQMMVAIESTRSQVYGAAALADALTPSTDAAAPLRLECGAAKARASETFCFCAQEAIQLHGGVGFTWEYDPQLYFKRALAGRHWLGSPDQWHARIAAALLD
ncbi:MAG TPA: acyl-CoA dehydrogenase family protein [Burkholderiaceae bacterium]|nr:acyl-CoA dehydrogenase family protein [Burkholderiaceae bacterium]